MDLRFATFYFISHLLELHDSVITRLKLHRPSGCQSHPRKMIHGGFDSLHQHVQQRSRCIWVWPERWAQNMRCGVVPAFVIVVGTICANSGRQGLAEDANATLSRSIHRFCGAATHHMHYIQWTIDLSMQNSQRYVF
ncbi:unnamed protein product [Xylocopa violacea]|uniref:Uncharacterized protein n=1 Tax=Xylocopa violacea TaxID=135666 RepID=A0ABP1NAN7_XYLVO